MVEKLWNCICKSKCLTSDCKIVFGEISESRISHSLSGKLIFPTSSSPHKLLIKGDIVWKDVRNWLKIFHDTIGIFFWSEEWFLEENCGLWNNRIFSILGKTKEKREGGENIVCDEIIRIIFNIFLVWKKIFESSWENFNWKFY